MTRGRPTKYKSEYCAEIISFFSKKTFHEIKDKSSLKRIANPLPYLSSFARKIGVNQDTLHEWPHHQ